MKLTHKIIAIILILTLGFAGLQYFVKCNNNMDQKHFSYEVKARVLTIDDSNVTIAGLSAIGNQFLKIVILEGDYKEQIFNASYSLTGALEYDNQFKKGEIILVALNFNDADEVIAVRAIEKDRSWALYLLLVLFIVILILYAGPIGIKALLSFVTAFILIWKFTIPMLLRGSHVLAITMTTIILLSAIIIFLVAGFTVKGLSAFVGTCLGLFITTGLTIFVGDQLGIVGMTAPYAQTIYFGGYFNLNMLHIFYAAVLVGSSGAAMDIAMDVASSMNEIREKNPMLSARELIMSGFNVGRDVIGTMTTTLLLAYSGSYLTLLMLLQIREISFMKIINMKLVSAEVMRTLVGSIGLILVAPTTAIISGFLYTKMTHHRQ